MFSSLALLAALAAHAQAPQDPQALLTEAHKEVRSIDDLVDDADRRSVQRDLHDKLEHLDDLLTQLAMTSTAHDHDRDHDHAHDHDHGGDHDGDAGMSMHVDEHGMQVSMHGGDADGDYDGDHDGGGHHHDHDGDVPPPPPDDGGAMAIPAPMGPVACSDADFAQIQAAVQNEPFGDGKKQVLSSAASSRWFSVAQVVTLLNDFSFSSDKVDVAASLYPHVADPQNWYQVYNAFTFASDKQELRKRVGQ